MIIGTGVKHQDALINSSNNVKNNKYQNGSKNALFNVKNSS